MSALNKIILLTLIQFSLSFSQEYQEKYLNNDTLEIKDDYEYVLFSGNGTKINSVIRKSSDLEKRPNSFYLYHICKDKKFKKNKDYLFLSVVSKNDKYIRGIICDDILSDTPENREKLIKKYEKKVIIHNGIGDIYGEFIRGSN